jgi:biopolymer transport protein ExbD
MARRVVSDEDATRIDLAPMIDCIFILLIFFIVTTVFVEEQGLQASKPDAAAHVSLEENVSVAFEITPDNKIRYEGDEIPLADVTSRVKAAVTDPEIPVVIRAHEKSDHGTFVAVWNAAKLGGAQALSFNTVD